MSWIQWLESRTLFTAHPGESIHSAADRMAAHRVGALVVVDGKKLVGILSERDIICRVLAKRLDPETTTVEEVCTTDIKTVSEDSTITECANLIKQHGFRHVPVVDADGSPVAMLSSRNFLRFALEELESLIAKSYAQQRVEELTDPYSLID